MADNDIAELVVVACTGTSDLPVAREALLTARHLERRVELVVDIGIAGLHRTLSKLELFHRAGVVVVVAGMDGALPGLTAGLVAAPVVAVPTSVGYGAAFNGLAPLLTMLNACDPGVGWSTSTTATAGAPGRADRRPTGIARAWNTHPGSVLDLGNLSECIARSVLALVQGLAEVHHPATPPSQRYTSRRSLDRPRPDCTVRLLVGRPARRTRPGPPSPSTRAAKPCKAGFVLHCRCQAITSTRHGWRRRVIGGLVALVVVPILGIATLWPGIDPISAVRVGFAALTGGNDAGGARLEQQLAKNLPPEHRVWTRCRRPSGPGTGRGLLEERGSAAVSGHGYFGVAPARLNWAQASMLAGLVQAPSAYDSTSHLSGGRLRQRHVPNRLVTSNVLSAAQADAAFATPLRWR